MKSGGSVHIKTPTKRKKETKLLNLGRTLPGLHNLWQPDTFFANVTKNLHTRYEKIIQGRIRCEKAPQVVGPGPSVMVLQQYSNFHVTCYIFISKMRCFSVGASL